MLARHFDPIGRLAGLDGARRQKELPHWPRPVGKGRLGDIEPGLDVVGGIIAPALANDLGRVAKLVLIPLHPLRQVGDDDEAIVLEADGADVLACRGPALVGAWPVAAVERGIERLLHPAKRRLLGGEIIYEAGEFRCREGGDIGNREIPDLLGDDDGGVHDGQPHAASARAGAIGAGQAFVAIRWRPLARTAM